MLLQIVRAGETSSSSDSKIPPVRQDHGPPHGLLNS